MIGDTDTPAHHHIVADRHGTGYAAMARDHAAATDADLPAQALTYSLVGAPAGATVGATTGVFSWTPSESAGPGTYPITVRVAASC